MQNFPQLVIKFILKNIRTASNPASTMVLGYDGCGFESQLAVYTEGAGPVCKCTGQCTLEGSVGGKF